MWVVGGYGCPAKEREGTPVFPYCLFGVVGGCGRPARDRKDFSCGSKCYSCLPGNFRWLTGGEGVHKCGTSWFQNTARMMTMFVLALALWLRIQLAFKSVVSLARRDMAATNCCVRWSPGFRGGEKSLNGC